ncbi:hypothetical protein C479_03356 [Halovivax asiaticus JCM 14624]|uniref:DUF3784 domain-containing protein n=1 Tax=Halovivax asiaticus JCM 14624 TaxID=1227490 RepID=M0BSC7_9EURY|nr:hypothetical protein [Halovivax asiaticus]ELZ13850.1 hypothetical protein C479_03356 [Halovivax asiaticus JCM 14624]
MVEVHWLSGGVWALGGVCMLGLGYLIAFRDRVDLHADFDESGAVDRTVAGRRVGAVALLMGSVTLGYGLREMIVGFDPTALGVLLVLLLVGSWFTRLFAKGWSPAQSGN